MSLAHVQSAIASLVCDRRALDAHARSPRAWLAASGLPASAARHLDGIEPCSLRLFHDIHARDRAYVVQAVLPLATQRLGPEWIASYFDAAPFGDDDARREAAAFIDHLDAGGADPAARDVARVELARLGLLDEPPFSSAPSGAEEHALEAALAARPAAGIALVPCMFDVPALFDDPHQDAAPAWGVVILRRDEDGVALAWLDGVVGDVLTLVARGDVASLRALAETAAARRALLAAFAEGVIS